MKKKSLPVFFVGLLMCGCQMKEVINEYNVVPLQIQPSGRGEYMPVDDNETAEGRSKNRRTEIIMAPKLDKLFQMLQSSEESK